MPAAGYPAQAGMSPAMRAASADRERAVDVLKAGFTEGRLTQDEYNERISRAYAARTYGELAAITADLPAGAMPAVFPVPMYQPPVTTNSLARASLVLGVAEFFTMGLTAIPAIICGHMAKREMRQTGQRGDGLATSGLVLGYMAVIFWGILIALSIVGAVITATGGYRIARLTTTSAPRRFVRTERRPGQWHSWRPSRVYTLKRRPREATGGIRSRSGISADPRCACGHRVHRG